MEVRMRPSTLLRLLLVCSFLTFGDPFASAQGVNDICSTNTICISLFVVLLVILLVSYYSRKAKETATRRPGEPTVPGEPRTPKYGSRQGTAGYGNAPAYPGSPRYPAAPMPQDAPSYQGAPTPQYAPQYPGAPGIGTAPSAPYAGADFTTALAQPLAQRQRRAKSASRCPRCGSSAVEDFDTGEHKCHDCKKIFMD
jgi:hypothetical protein